MPDNEDFGAMLDAFEQSQPRTAPKVGDSVRGRVVSIGPEYALVDLGIKAEAAIEVADLTGDDGQLTVAVGDTIEAVIARQDERSGTLILGSEQGRRLHGREELESAYREQLPVEGLVSAVIKGGVEVQVAGLRAFCPAGQVDIRFTEDLEKFVGERLTFRITRLEGGARANVVLSRRMLLEEEQQALAAQTRARLQVGAVLPGTVTSLKDFGAFIDLGGIEGMVHISELSHERVQHPSEVLSVGQAVEVSVLRIERTDNPRHPERIGLSIRALAADPWQSAEQRFPTGARIRGKVSRLQPFGAFIELAPGIDGLAHISALGAGRRIGHPREVLSEGQEIEVVVLGVDKEKRRISLSLETAPTPEVSQAEIRAYGAAEPSSGKLGTFGELLQQSLGRQKPER
ncbi:MAG: 30S ribosomal protein S1 [Gammaproteobacteria bacterium]|nr:30S ribosomal protein S1 [Gammaproteobacteria bacterium]